MLRLWLSHQSRSTHRRNCWRKSGCGRVVGSAGGGNTRLVGINRWFSSYLSVQSIWESEEGEDRSIPCHTFSSQYPEISSAATMSVDAGAKAGAAGVAMTMEVDMVLKRAATSNFASARRISFFLAAS